MALLWCAHAGAVTLADRARESGCTTKPTPMSSALYKCQTRTGAEAFFNVPDGRGESAPTTARSAPTPSNFPRVDSDTQKSRDEMRRKVLGDELSAEEKLLADTRAEYGNGAPQPLAEEKDRRRALPPAHRAAASGRAAARAQRRRAQEGARPLTSGAPRNARRELACTACARRARRFGPVQRAPRDFRLPFRTRARCRRRDVARARAADDCRC